MTPFVQSSPASSSLLHSILLKAVQRSPISYSSVLYNEGLTVGLFGLWMWRAFVVGVDILCGLDDLGYEISLEGFKMRREVSDETIDLANAPT